MDAARLESGAEDALFSFFRNRLQSSQQFADLNHSELQQIGARALPKAFWHAKALVENSENRSISHLDEILTDTCPMTFAWKVQELYKELNNSQEVLIKAIELAAKIDITSNSDPEAYCENLSRPTYIEKLLEALGRELSPKSLTELMQADEIKAVFLEAAKELMPSTLESLLKEPFSFRDKATIAHALQEVSLHYNDTELGEDTKNDINLSVKYDRISSCTSALVKKETDEEESHFKQRLPGDEDLDKALTSFTRHSTGSTVSSLWFIIKSAFVDATNLSVDEFPKTTESLGKVRGHDTEIPTRDYYAREIEIAKAKAA